MFIVMVMVSVVLWVVELIGSLVLSRRHTELNMDLVPRFLSVCVLPVRSRVSSGFYATPGHFLLQVRGDLNSTRPSAFLTATSSLPSSFPQPPLCVQNLKPLSFSPSPVGIILFPSLFPLEALFLFCLPLEVLPSPALYLLEVVCPGPWSSQS